MSAQAITMRGIEVFHALAQTGSVAKASQRMGLSQPAVSQHLRNLEAALGTDLVDHGRRPMRLTAAGRGFLPRTERILHELRLAQSEVTVLDLSHLSELNIGIIDDFDTDLTPNLLNMLAGHLSHSRLHLGSGHSNQIITQVQAKTLHLGIAAHDDTPLEGVSLIPLMTDPFVLVTPKDAGHDPAEYLHGAAGLPLLRYDGAQLIGAMVERMLTQHGIAAPARFHMGSHHALMALVAQGFGWAITTPLGFKRAGRFHDQIDVHPLPLPPAARQISLLADPDWAPRVPQDVARAFLSLAKQQMVDPLLHQIPWLEGRLTLSDAAKPA